MQRDEVRARLEAALRMLVANDAYLLTHDLGERCIASRLAMYLQAEFREYAADAEYNRLGDIPKRLELPRECAGYRNEHGESLVVPDVLVHLRGPEGPNILVLEVKKTSNPSPRDCDRARVRAFREQLGYEFGALIECETRPSHEPGARVVEWLGG
ncbi:MAG TPA: hypothetical protein VJX29_04140 [Candidatus Acidoferrales bacterium]|nr:hypothetical protein [Candidatus Acidoferrales bacterium]